MGLYGAGQTDGHTVAPAGGYGAGAACGISGQKLVGIELTVAGVRLPNCPMIWQEA